MRPAGIIFVAAASVFMPFSGLSAAEPLPVKVLLIGDSLSVGGFGDGLQASLTATRSELDDAERKNGELFQLANQILDEYTAEGTFQRLFRGEGATGIRRVQLENLAQDYAGKLQNNLRPAARDKASPP